jgi:radical SAM superfamily enzyme YgiQ (UPF0313 family)
MRIGLVNLDTGSTDRVWNIGLLSMASYIQSRSRHKVTIIDTTLEPLIPKIQSGNFDVIGFSSMTATYERACRFAHIIKQFYPRIKTVIGGVHISTLPLSKRDCFDHVVLGEGELQLLDVIEKRNVNGPWRMDLDDYPPLDYSLIDHSYFKPQYLNVWETNAVAGHVITSRGCPYSCIFCSSTNYWKRVTYFPVDWVVRDIEEQFLWGAEIISIWDDLFAINRRRLQEIGVKLKEHGLAGRIRFVCQAKTNVFDDRIAEALCQMNVKMVNFGFESGSERILKKLKCGTATVKDHERALKTCKKHGLRVLGSFIMGTPTETYREKLASVRLMYKAARYGADCLWYTALTPYPGTPIWDQAERNGEVSSDMNFNLIQLSAGKVWQQIPKSLRLLMFILRAFLKLRRMFYAKKTLG